MITKIEERHFIQVTELAELMHSQSNNFPIRFVALEFIKTLVLTVTRPHEMCGFVYLDNGKVVGAIIGRVFKADFSDQLIAQDVGVFVLPEFRNSRAGIQLIKAYRDWAQVHADMVTFGANAGIDNQRAVKVLSRCGFEAMGTTLILKG